MHIARVLSFLSLLSSRHPLSLPVLPRPLPQPPSPTPTSSSHATMYPVSRIPYKLYEHRRSRMYSIRWGVPWSQRWRHVILFFSLERAVACSSMSWCLYCNIIQTRNRGWWSWGRRCCSALVSFISTTRFGKLPSVRQKSEKPVTDFAQTASTPLTEWKKTTGDRGDRLFFLECPSVED